MVETFYAGQYQGKIFLRSLSRSSISVTMARSRSSSKTFLPRSLQVLSVSQSLSLISLRLSLSSFFFTVLWSFDLLSNHLRTSHASSHHLFLQSFPQRHPSNSRVPSRQSFLDLNSDACSQWVTLKVPLSSLSLFSLQSKYMPTHLSFPPPHS